MKLKLGRKEFEDNASLEWPWQSFSVPSPIGLEWRYLSSRWIHRLLDVIYQSSAIIMTCFYLPVADEHRMKMLNQSKKTGKGNANFIANLLGPLFKNRFVDYSAHIWSKLPKLQLLSQLDSNSILEMWDQFARNWCGSKLSLCYRYGKLLTIRSCGICHTLKLIE